MHKMHNLWSATRTKHRFTRFPRRTNQHIGSNMIYTEAQSIDEAVDYLMDIKKFHKPPKRRFVEEKKVPVTLPKLKWMEGYEAGKDDN